MSKLYLTSGYAEEDGFTFEKDNINYYLMVKDNSWYDCLILAVDYGIRRGKAYSDKKGIVVPVSCVFEQPKSKVLFKGELKDFNWEKVYDSNGSKIFEKWLENKNLLIKEIV